MVQVCRKCGNVASCDYAGRCVDCELAWFDAHRKRDDKAVAEVSE